MSHNGRRKLDHRADEDRWLSVEIRSPRWLVEGQVFHGRGFSLGAPDELATALASHATTFWPGRIVSNAYVTKHIVIGPLTCPDGSRPEIVAIWKLDVGATVARLVTAYPHR